MRNLIISADDYGYAPAYDRGILEAARAGAVDAVSVMVDRGPLDTASLLATGVELGVHIELEAGSSRADAERQLDAFEAALGPSAGVSRRTPSLPRRAGNREHRRPARG